MVMHGLGVKILLCRKATLPVGTGCEQRYSP
jgi:hypothetical protein